MRRAAAPLLLALVLAPSACGGSAPTSSASPSATTTVIPEVSDIAGEVVVTDLDAIRYTGSGSTCVTLAPYRSIGRGARVVVRSDTGSIKAITHLYGGTLRREGSSARPAGCVFGFDYAGAAAGRPSYTVRVADQPPHMVSFAGLTHVTVVVPRA